MYCFTTNLAFLLNMNKLKKTSTMCVHNNFECNATSGGFLSVTTHNHIYRFGVLTSLISQISPTYIFCRIAMEKNQEKN